jgi:hypothetical protein
MLALAADDQHARVAGVVERLHGVAQRREERRRHRVHALGTVQHQLGDAGGRILVEAEEIVHGAMMARHAACRAGRLRRPRHQAEESEHDSAAAPGLDSWP